MTKDPSKKRVGVRALAKSTGLSVATISRVLNNSDTVTKDTREKVLQAIVQTGYTPNPAARALATQRTRTIGAVVPTVSSSIFSRFLDSIEVELAKNGYALVIATSDFDPERETERARDLINLGAEALILSGSDHQPELLSLIAAASIPVLCSSVHKTANGLAAIGYDNEQIAHSAITYLSDLGHQKIAIIHGPKATNDRTALRLAGAVNGARDCAVDLHLHGADLSVEGGVDGAREIYRAKPDTTAILCLSDVIALGVFFESQRQSVAIPDAISLMGFDDLDWSSLTSPALTTIHLPTGRMGVEIASALISRLDDSVPLESLTLDAHIVERGSTARPRTAVSPTKTAAQ